MAIVELPFRLAPGRAGEGRVRQRARQARREMGGDIPRVLGGHSRGAAIATRLMARAPVEYRGLVLIATTHPRMDLSDLNVPVLKIGATRDCVASREKSEAAAGKLSPGTEWRWI